MNALAAMIQEWIDAEPGRSRRLLARKAGIGAATIDTWFREDELASGPQKDTLDRLAKGLGVPLVVIERAAVSSTGRRFAQSEVGPDAEVILAALDEVPHQMRPRVADIVLRIIQIAQKTP